MATVVQMVMGMSHCCPFSSSPQFSNCQLAAQDLRAEDFVGFPDAVQRETVHR
jgi:hypothetical protein